ncbi:MAG: cbb3-type cytochrome c oxidase subunit I [Acidimicrobiia bacterium]|nr:cbb3-type cytochrome c oxidase subunit I [Acidimicrobiia bacterium]
MSTIDTSPDTLAAPAAAVERTGVGRTVALGAFLASADHKVIGRMFIGTSVLALVGTAVLGALLGIERIDGDAVLLDAGALPQLFTGFRLALVYGVLVPFLLGVAVAIVPLQLGARALAFPRLAAAGFWGWLAGLVLLVISLAGNGGPLGGDPDMVDLFLAAHVLVVLGLAAAATSVATTVLTTRAPGMRMRRVPFFSWSALVASIGLLLVLPVIVGTLIYLFVDHRNARAAFGGNAGIAAWLGFAWTQPTTYLFALPAVGLAAELIPVTFRRRMPLRGVVYTGLALVGAAAFAGVTQQAGFVVPWSGSQLNLGGLGQKIEDLVPYVLFMLVPLLGVLVVMGVGALAAKPNKGGPRPRLTAPFVFSFFGVGMILVGMLGGVLSPIADLGLQGTVFEEASLVYVAYGGALAGLGAVAYWLPKWAGVVVADIPAIGLATLGVLATVLASFPHYLAGFADQPAAAGQFDNDGPSALWNGAVTAGHALMALVVVGFVGLVVKARRTGGEPVGSDPWEAHTLEWLTSSPAPAGNFPEPPTVMSPEPAYDLRAAPRDDRDEGAS